MSKRKLLLADDSITIQKVVNLTFADEGIEVISVGDGDSAMVKINESAPDLILADVNMPGLNGYQICEKIKQNAVTQRIPVILLVGSFEPFDEAEAYRVGADDYLTKPFQSIRQLVSKVSDLLESANGAAIPIAENPELNIEESDNSDLHFVDTREFPKVNAENSVELGDTGMDDEMIQTNQVGSLPIDETQKFMSGAQTEATDEREENSINKPIYNDFETPRSFEATAADSGQTYSLNEQYFQPFSAEENEQTDSSTVYDFAGETADSNQETAENQAVSTEETLEIGEFQNETAVEYATRGNSIFDDEKISEKISDEVSPPVAAASNLSFDDMDLLELPSIKPQTSVKSAAVETKMSEPATVKTAEKSASVNERVNQFSRLSPEMIEAIAQKVSEKISDKAIREIAWELVPQLTASIIKKMEQEKPKE
ncbi:MAG: response regulator [Pyrinomonadaceae bacterium]|nr:response regulator [Pyrinomonadaceae bacterium]